MSTNFKQKNVVAAYSPVFAAQTNFVTALALSSLTSVLPLPRDARPLPNIRRTRDETRECRGKYLIGRRLTSRLALWTLRFTDVSAQFVAGIMAMAQGAAAAATGTNEVQTLTITATGGTYTLSVTVNGDTQTTTALAYNANAAAIQAALEALSNVAPGDLVVTGTGPFTITAGGTLADEDIAPLVPGVGSLTGGSAAITTATPGAGRFHQITHGASDDVPKTSFIIGTEDDSGEPMELYKGMCVNRVQLAGEVRGKVSMDVDFCGSANVEVIDPGDFDFAACQTQAAIYANDCQLLINAIDRTADLRRFSYTFNNNLLIGDDPFPFDAVDAVRIERDVEDSLFNFALYGTKAHAVYVDAEAETTRAVALRIGAATEYAKIIAAGAQLALQDTPIGYAGEANRSVINVDAVPFSIGGAAPDRVEALLTQQSRFLVAP
jgi:hypothetical protein